MYKDLKFPILISHPDAQADTVAGQRVRGIADELHQEGFEIILTSSASEGRIVATTHHGLAGILVAAEPQAQGAGLFDTALEWVALARQRAPQLPVFALGEQSGLDEASNQALIELHQLRGLLYLFEDTVPFLARQVARAARSYLEALLPPFFKALVKHTADSNYSWHTPGHGGGVAYRKSPVGHAFHQFFGENTLRSDLSVSVPELGSLLDHTGPVAEAEARAAANFGADHTFFVINGTSTANKIVWQSMVGRGDLVLVDRNCHKSILHAIIMTGAIPLYLSPKRNGLGIIGPIPLEEFSQASLAAKQAASPLAAQSTGKLRLAVLTNCTYDGLCYSAEQIKQALAGAVEVLHFDEAWFAYAAFHEFYAGRFGMGTACDEHSPLVFSTHSTHKLLAAFSQSSMIHVQNGGQRQLDPERFNEAFMMHISTSPQYGILASLDVASAMLEGGAGRSLIQECFDEALGFRRALARVRRTLAPDQWWFSIWQPARFAEQAQLNSDDWRLEAGDQWHGFGDLAEDYVLLDPLKVTLLMPGLDAGGELAAWGIPAAVVSKFLWERGLVVEKTGLYSFLVLFSMGVTRGKWSTLLTELLEFKRCYDRNEPLENVLPSLLREDYLRYRQMGLRDLCDQLHGCYKDNGAAKALQHMYRDLPPAVVSPGQAYDALVRGAVEQVPIEQLAGRVAAVMLVPYPPGIPLIMPGERFAKTNQPIIDYLQFACRFAGAFPGFELDIHGIKRSLQDGQWCYSAECLIEH